MEFFYCCHHHVHTEGLWDSLYMPHKPENCNQWQADKDKRYDKKKKARVSGSILPPIISPLDKMKFLLATKCKISPSDIDEMVKDGSLK